MPTQQYKNEDLQAGSLIKDLDSGDLGLLIFRFDLMKSYEDEEPIWIWDMHWVGPTTDYLNKNIPFIEQAIIGLLNGGVWELCADNSDE